MYTSGIAHVGQCVGSMWAHIWANMLAHYWLNLNGIFCHGITSVIIHFVHFTMISALILETVLSREIFT